MLPKLFLTSPCHLFPAGHMGFVRPVVFPPCVSLCPQRLRCSGGSRDVSPPVSFCLQPEEKQRASAAFAQLRAAMGTLGITAEEQAAIWRVLAGIYHLGAAGACKGKGGSRLSFSYTPSRCRGFGEGEEAHPGGVRCWLHTKRRWGAMLARRL